MPKFKDLGSASGPIDAIFKVIEAAGDRAAEVVLTNNTAFHLDFWGQVTGVTGGGKGSGAWAPGDGPDDTTATLDPGEALVLGLESTGAGAVGLLVYRVRATNYFLFLNFSAPVSGTSGAFARLVRSPSLAKQSSASTDAVQFFFTVFNHEDYQTEPTHVSTFGLKASCYPSGVTHIQAEFTLDPDPNTDAYVFRDPQSGKFISMMPPVWAPSSTFYQPTGLLRLLPAEYDPVPLTSSFQRLVGCGDTHFVGTLPLAVNELWVTDQKPGWLWILAGAPGDPSSPPKYSIRAGNTGAYLVPDPNNGTLIIGGLQPYWWEVISVGYEAG